MFQSEFKVQRNSQLIYVLGDTSTL